MFLLKALHIMLHVHLLHVRNYACAFLHTCALPTPLFISVCYDLSYADLWVEAEAPVFGCTSSKFRRGEMYCLHIICGVNSPSLYTTEPFWWIENKDKGVFRSSTTICKKVNIWMYLSVLIIAVVLHLW